MASVVIMATVACNSPLHFAALQLGTSLNADHTIATHTTRFKPDDTIYASVLTDRTGSSTIVARWSYSGRMVSEMERKVSYKGDGATEFRFQSAEGFPSGDYKVDILIDGQAVASRDFRIEP